MKEIMEDVERWRAEGKKVAIATVVATRRSAPRPIGAKLAISETGELCGSVSGGCVESDVYENAREVMESGTPKLLPTASPTRRPGKWGCRAAERSTSSWSVWTRTDADRPSSSGHRSDGGGSCRGATGACPGPRRRPPRPPRASSHRRRCPGGRRGSVLRRGSRPCDHSIVARNVCWRGSGSRPPLSKSSRCAIRSMICSGVSTLVRAAANSTASGMSSRRRHSSADRLVRIEP